MSPASGSVLGPYFAPPAVSYFLLAPEYPDVLLSVFSRTEFRRKQLASYRPGISVNSHKW